MAFDERLLRRYRQVLPRPDGVVVEQVPAAHFAALGPSKRAGLLTAVRARAVFGHESLQDLDSAYGASVLVPLRDDGEGLSVTLIRRASHLRANPGEMAFPGGRIEAGESVVEAALREAFEEVELRREQIEVLGMLPPVARASRPEPIASVVGLLKAHPRLVPSPAEVDGIVTVRLEHLADAGSYWEETWSRPDGSSWRMPMFDLGGDVVWGASARILVLVLEMLVAS
jgi:8-oxo-dGTP pyrophosphatase MutT (NUDIX family)